MGNYRYLAIGITIIATIAIAIAQQTFLQQWLPVVTTLTVGFVISVLVALEELRVSIEKMNRFSQTARRFRLENAFEEILDGFDIIHRSRDKLFEKEARKRVCAGKKAIADASRGILHVTRPSDLTAIPIWLMESFQESLDATLVWTDDPITGGRKAAYLKQMRKAIEDRKVAIRRLFVIPEGAEHNDEFMARVRSDQEMRVDVRYLHESEWDDGDNTEKGPVDFGVWDAKRVWSFNNNCQLPACERGAVIRNRSEDVRVYSDLFTANWKRAYELPVE